MEDNGFFAPPPFKPEEALIQLKRSLRDLRAFNERGSGFELKGQAVIELALDGAQIHARIAKRPARSPEWETRALKNSADVRQFIADVKKRLANWSSDE
ncbi:MAG TPA: hypothetical protein VFV25_05105 [Methylibium sp.]